MQQRSEAEWQRATASSRCLAYATTKSTAKFRFNGASFFNQDIGDWDVGNVKDMIQMFSSADSFDQDLGGWDIANVEDMRKMFAETKLSTTNYDSLLKGWAQQDVHNGVKFHGGESQYSEQAVEAR